MQYIARLVANDHSNGGSMSSVISVRLLRKGEADNASHIPKTCGRTNKEFRRQNLRKIPLAPSTQHAASLFCAHTQPNSFFLFPSIALPLLNLKRLPMPCLLPYIADHQNNKEHSSHRIPMNISEWHRLHKFFQRFTPKTLFEIAAFTQLVKKHLCNKTTQTPSVFYS